MSKPASDILFRFIKTLTPAEKRYFKLYASRHTIGEKNEYLRLFETIDKMLLYDEAGLKNAFRKMRARNSLAIAKNRLYETILKSLDSYHAESSVDVELRSLLHYAEILNKKSLYDECFKMLQRAKKIAHRHERYTVLIDIGRWEKRIIEKDGYATIDEEGIASLLEQDQQILQKLNNYHEFWNLKSRLFFLLNRHGKVRDQQEVIQFKTLIDNTLLKSEDKALSFESRYLYYHIYSAYYFGIGDYKQSYSWLRKHLELMESNNDFILDETNKYFATLSNLIYLCTQLHKHSEINVLLRKLHNIPTLLGKRLTEDLAIKLFSTTYSTELSLSLQTGDYEKAFQLIPEIEAGLKKYKKKISKVREAFFLFNVSVLYFAMGDFTQSLQWINRLLNDSELDASQEIYAFARIFDLIIHLEMGNNDLIPYTLKSVQRYLDKRKRMFKFETVFLEFVRKISKANSKQEIESSYVHLREELKTLASDQFEKTVFEYFDFNAWVESKLQKTSIAEIVRKKHSGGKENTTLLDY